MRRKETGEEEDKKGKERSGDRHRGAGGGGGRERTRKGERRKKGKRKKFVFKSTLVIKELFMSLHYVENPSIVTEGKHEINYVYECMLYIVNYIVGSKCVYKDC